jgi:hypothetical protein
MHGRFVPAGATSLLVLLAAIEVGADVLPPGMKSASVTFELTGVEGQPEYLFVVYPYLDNEIGDEFLRMNPDHDRPGTNYQVLAEGEHYVMPKFGGGQFYAFSAQGFTTDTVKLDEDQGFYRKAGSELVIIPEFDAMKESEKKKFVATDPRVRRSGMSLAIPLLLPRASPFAGTHDVFHVATVDDQSLKVEGIKVVLMTEEGGAFEARYQNGRRPNTVGGELEFSEAPRAKNAPPDDPSHESSPTEGAASSDNSNTTIVFAGVAMLFGGWLLLGPKRPRT